MRSGNDYSDRFVNYLKSITSKEQNMQTNP